MDNIATIIKFCGAGITAAFTYVFGGADTVLCLLMVFITLDYTTGVLASIINKELSSEVGFRGLIKKVGILVIVAVAHLISQFVGFDIRTWVIGYYIANEGISILENAGRMGVPYPERLVNIMEQLKKGDDNENT